MLPTDRRIGAKTACSIFGEMHAVLRCGHAHGASVHVIDGHPGPLTFGIFRIRSGEPFGLVKQIVRAIHLIGQGKSICWSHSFPDGRIRWGILRPMHEIGGGGRADGP